MDLGTIYRDATRRCVPQATICFDPFHVIQTANRALDSVFKASERFHPTGVGDRDWRRSRVALRTGAEHLDQTQRQLVNAFRRSRHRLGRAWELKEGLRDLYRVVEPAAARRYLRAWINSAARCRIAAFVNLSRQIKRNFEQIVAAVELHLSNARLEGVMAHIRVIQRRGYGYHSVDSLASMIFLCLGGIKVELPTGR